MQFCSIGLIKIIIILKTGYVNNFVYESYCVYSRWLKTFRVSVIGGLYQHAQSNIS